MIVETSRNLKYRIMIETTNICNAKCSFCANPILKRKKMVMTDELFDLLIRRIHDEKIEVEKFILHLNGEPFTDKNLIARIRCLNVEFPESPIWFTTNFNLPSKQTIDELLHCNIDTMTISLNSSDADEYEKIMHLKYEKTIANMNYLLEKKQELDVPIHIRVSIVDTGNSNAVKKFVEKYDEVMEVRVIKLGNWMGHEDQNIILRERMRRNECKDLNSQICILSNGDFAICCFDSEGMVGLNIRDTSLMNGFYSNVFENLRIKIRESGVKGTLCENCSFSMM